MSPPPLSSPKKRARREVGGVCTDINFDFCWFGLNCFSSMNDSEDDDTADFRRCIRVLAERVSYLSRRREEHLKVEAAVEQLRKELDEKKELVKTLYTKHQLEKQVIF